MERNDLLAKHVQNKQVTGKKKQTALNEKMESDKLLNTYKNDLVWATELLKDHPQGIIIGSAFSIVYDQASYLIIEGFNPKYKELNPNYLIKWKMISEAKNRNFKYVNFNGISGDFTKDTKKKEKKDTKYHGLNEMKLGYNAVITEYIGEFDFIINNLTYNLYRNLNKDNGKKQEMKK